MKLYHRLPTITRNFSLWNGLRARVLQTPLFGTPGKTHPPPQAPREETISPPLNVFKRPLAFFSDRPVTGFYRDGYCRTGAADFGNHAVAGVVSEEFLDYSASQGNDLRVAGLTDGCKWCLCTSRWLEAFQAYTDGKISKTAVPRVYLEATEDSALRRVDLDTLREFAAKKETSDANGVNGVHGV
ncbi:hypothetical protein A1O3_03161 [Capronia epimyces CBS 606.96]|uniref:Uncharacterized protein n=1 Tax=Capronia epimyces CBS 606.96 TaxID=1182542 RepID=W9YB53_9EURO|nr:uncharacterized protein A1O3_03161 [Capronia epimyces CBS 606.96]EXJ90092.1 hypothetical protein A1O3_03161 [Capronia epimyces CBS 606.96]